MSQGFFSFCVFWGLLVLLILFDVVRFASGFLFLLGLHPPTSKALKGVQKILIWQTRLQQKCFSFWGRLRLSLGPVCLLFKGLSGRL